MTDLLRNLRSALRGFGLEAVAVVGFVLLAWVLAVLALAVT